VYMLIVEAVDISRQMFSREKFIKWAF